MSKKRARTEVRALFSSWPNQQPRPLTTLWRAAVAHDVDLKIVHVQIGVGREVGRTLRGKRRVDIKTRIASRIQIVGAARGGDLKIDDRRRGRGWAERIDRFDAVVLRRAQNCGRGDEVQIQAVGRQIRGASRQEKAAVAQARVQVQSELDAVGRGAWLHEKRRIQDLPFGRRVGRVGAIEHLKLVEMINHRDPKIAADDAV